MKIEEIAPKDNHHVINERQTNIQAIKEINPKENKKKPSNSYWFPLSKGFNRLIFVLFIIIPVFPATTGRSGEIIPVYIVFLMTEAIFYFVAIWIYQGFKESSKSSNNEK